MLVRQMHSFFFRKKENGLSLTKEKLSSNGRLSPSLGPQTKQYSGQVGLHSEDSGLWSGEDCRHQLHDDPVCGD